MGVAGERDPRMCTKHGLKAFEARRLAGARLLERGVTQAEVARELGVSRQAVSAWARALAEVDGEADRLEAKTLGRPARLDASQCEALLRLLTAGARQAGYRTDKWTVKRVCAVLAREFGAQYSLSGCWELLRRLGVSLSSPDQCAACRGTQAEQGV